MAYTKNTWVDQEGQVRYTETVDDGYKIFTPNYEEVTEMGTPVNALNMNHIEEGIEQCYVDFENMIKAIYPVGSIYIGTTASCPMSALFGTWVKISEGLTLQQADSNHPVGSVVPAGLPNIQGTLNFSGTDGAPSSTGAFVQTHASTGAGKGHNSGQSKCRANVVFDASDSSTIYGSSDTVQPPALAVNIWQRTA